MRLACAALVLVTAGCQRAAEERARAAEATAREALEVAREAEQRAETSARPPVAWADEFRPAADGANRFAFDLYARLAAEPGNVFFSPFSVSTALAMTADGADGETLAQMRAVLHLPADRAKAAAGWGGLGRYYAAGGKPYELAVANALWGQKGLPWKADFLARQKDHYGAELTPLDFAAGPDAARGRINTWVADATRGKVRDLLGPADVTERTRMVLTNAIYFKGAWAERFPTYATKESPFRLAGGGTVSVPLMFRKGSYRYFEGDGFQVAELPYQGGDVSMVVILPAKPDGLPAVEKQLTGAALDGWLARATPQDVEVYLPRFKLETKASLPKALKAVGMAAAFDPQAADFSGMLSGQRVSLSAVVHKAFVEVNEEGAEAAAATGVVSNAPSPVPPPPKVFRADRPFAFAIRDAKHGTVLFAGRLVKP